MGWLFRVLPLGYQDAVVAVGAGIFGITTGILGSFAVLRRRSLVGDALSHAALPGVAIAFLLTGTKDTSGLLIGAGAAALVGAVVIVGLERSQRLRADAAIGVVLSSFFSLGIVLLTYIGNLNNANQAGLEKYLFGQAAGLLERDVTVMAVLGVVAVTVVVISFRALKTTLFDVAFAASSGLPVRAVEIGMTALLVVAIVIGVRIVGTVLLVAMLIAPTVMARQFTSRMSTLLPLAGLIGMTVGISGSLLSAAARVPTGPVIVLVAFVSVLAAVLFAPGAGVIWRARQRARERRRTIEDAVLIELGTATSDTDVASLLRSSPHGRGRTKAAVRRLTRGRAVRVVDGRVDLTPLGAERLRAINDATRLWSLWLEHGWRLDLPDAREPDPRDLRRTLGDQLTRQLELMGAGS